MKLKIVFSLVIYGKSYIDSFEKYTLQLLKKNLANIDKKKHECILYLSCKIKEKERIELLLLDSFDSIEFFTIREKKFDKEYSILSEHQRLHNIQSKKNNNDYIFYLYADFLFNTKALSNALNKIVNNKIILTFALLLNAKNVNFDNFFQSMLDDSGFLEKINDYDLIDEYHQSFEKNSFNINKSFVYTVDKNKIFIKAFHSHPVILNLKLINVKNFERKFHTLDNGFLDCLNLKSNEIYVEEDLNGISMFSYDEVSRKRIESNIDISKKSLAIIDKGFFYINYNNRSFIEKYVFTNFTISNSLRDPNGSILDQYFNTFSLRKKYDHYPLRDIFTILKLYRENELVRKNFPFNYILIAFYALIFLAAYISLKNYFTRRMYLFIRKNLFHKIDKGFLKRKLFNDPNIIYSIYMAKIIYTYTGLSLDTFKNKLKSKFVKNMRINEI